MGLDCSPSRVQRFTTQTEVHKPVAGAPALISRQIDSFPSDTSFTPADDLRQEGPICGMCGRWFSNSPT